MKLLFSIALLALACNGSAADSSTQNLRAASEVTDAGEITVTEEHHRELVFVQETLVSPQGDDCKCGQGVWKDADEDEDPCQCSKKKWNGKENRASCPSSMKAARDIRLYIKTDGKSEDNDSYFFTSDTGKGVDETDGDDQLVRPLETLKNDKYYVWEACIDAEEDCFFFDFYTEKKSDRKKFGFILLSNGVPQLHMSGDPDNSSSDFEKNDKMADFKRVSLGRNCEKIDKVNRHLKFML